MLQVATQVLDDAVDAAPAATEAKAQARLGVRKTDRRAPSQPQSRNEPQMLDARIDRVHLARYTMGDLALEKEILGLFADQLPIMLKDVLDATSCEMLMRAAHTLKGSSRAIGAWSLAEAALKAEEIAHAEEQCLDCVAYRSAIQQLKVAAKATSSALKAELV